MLPKPRAPFCRQDSVKPENQGFWGTDLGKNPEIKGEAEHHSLGQLMVSAEQGQKSEVGAS